METLDLEDRYKEFIINSILKIIPNVEIYVYGSRVKGTAVKYSDVDIALKSGEEIPFDTVLKLKAFFNDSTFPYMVDIIDLNSINENFKNRIQKDLFKIY